MVLTIVLIMGMICSALPTLSNRPPNRSTSHTSRFQVRKKQ